MRLPRCVASSITILVALAPSLALAEEPASVPTLTQMSLRAGAALGAVILLIVALSVLLRRLRESTNASGQGRRLASLERLDLGAKREIRLVRADDRLLVVGITGDRMELLSESPLHALSETGPPEAHEASPFRMPRLRKVANPS